MPRAVLYEGLWSNSAAGDIDKLLSYIALDSPERAARVWLDIKRRAETLSRFPLRGRLVPELKAIGLGLYRELIVFPYRILFRIKGSRVLVLGVFDGRRDLEETLFERLTLP